MASNQIARVFVPGEQGIRDLPLSRVVQMVEKSGTELADDAQEMILPLHDQVLGQDPALGAIQAALRVQPAHTGRSARAYFVLEGPPGTGKSFTMRQLMDDADVADAVHGATLREPIGPSAVVGVPEPYSGSEVPSMLVQFDRARGVLGIDELEKANPEALAEVARATATGVDAQGYESLLGETIVVGTTSRGNGRQMAQLLAAHSQQPVTLIQMPRLSKATGQRIFERDLEAATARFAGSIGDESLPIDPAQLAGAEALIAKRLGLEGGRIAQAEARRVVREAVDQHLLGS